MCPLINNFRFKSKVIRGYNSGTALSYLSEKEAILISLRFNSAYFTPQQRSLKSKIPSHSQKINKINPIFVYFFFVRL